MISSKQLRHRVFGAYYREDMCDLYGARRRGLVKPLYWRFHPGIASRRVIFIHIPRAAGASVSASLFDDVHVAHHSMRAWLALEPEFATAAPSFALLRDPFARFASSYHFVRAGGASEVGLNGTFRRLTSHIDSIDAYLDFLDGKPALDLDFVMRPQSWFVSDLKTGKPLVTHLFHLDRDGAAIDDFLGRHGGSPLPHRNRSSGGPLSLTHAQRRHVEALYAADFELWES